MSHSELWDLYSLHTGKVSDKWAGYFYVYDDLLSSYRKKGINFLEIGVQNGGSLEIWAKYFENAKKILGCDINELCSSLKYEDERITVVIGDIKHTLTQGKIIDAANNLDVIIDDGSHLPADIISAFCVCYPLLNDSGIYIVEDLHCDYWGEYSGGLSNPDSAISFFKTLVDVINYDHWGLDYEPNVLVNPFFSKYECFIQSDLLKTISSIEFHNSICVIKKGDPSRGVYKERVIVGHEALVNSSVLNLPRSNSPPISQSNNIWQTSHQLNLKIEMLISELGEKNKILENIRLKFIYRIIDRIIAWYLKINSLLQKLF